MVVGEVLERPDAVVLGGQHEQLLAGLVLGQRRAGERLGGDHPFRQVVHAGEVVRSPASGDATEVEQRLERGLAVVVVPPGALLADPRLEIAGDQRPLVDDALVDLLDVVAELLGRVAGSPATGTARASASGRGGTGRRDEAGLVH